MNGRLMVRAAVPLLLTAMGMVGAGQAVAQRDRLVSIPEDTVVRVRLDQGLNSRDTTVGQRFTATLAADDRSGFPTDTRFDGVVTEVQPRDRDRPGILDTEFRRALLPDGRTVAVDGRLNGLSDEAVRRTTDGRLEARRQGGKKMDWKWAGYGAAGGALLGAVLGGGSGGLLKGAVLGGLGGAAYGYLNKRGTSADFRDVDLPRGTEFGVRLEQRVAFDDRDAYRYFARTVPYVDDRAADRYSDRPIDSRSDDRRADDRRTDDRTLDDRRDDRAASDRAVDDRDDQRVLARREEFRYGSTAVRVDGRSVRFTDARPMNLNGRLFVPLAPVADAADMRFTHRLGDSAFTLDTASGAARGFAGETRIRVGDQDSVTLDQAPLAIDGEIYVSAEFLSRVANMRADWDRNTLRLELETAR